MIILILKKSSSNIKTTTWHFFKLRLTFFEYEMATNRVSEQGSVDAIDEKTDQCFIIDLTVKFQKSWPPKFQTGSLQPRI